jgi:hypothetical protein
VSVAYGAKFGAGDIITLLLNFDAHTLTFFKNGESQGVAYEDLVGPVHLAASLTGTESAIQIVPTPASVTAALGAHIPNLLTSWDPLSKSVSLAIEPNGLLKNMGSSDKWYAHKCNRSHEQDATARVRILTFFCFFVLCIC